MSSYAVTGASRGLGLEFVKQLSSNPSNHVFALVRNASTAVALSDIAASRPNLHIITSDITDVSQIQAAAATISAITGGSLDVLIQNAAFYDNVTTYVTPTAVDSSTYSALESSIVQSMQHNVLAVINTTNVFLPLIRKGKEKKIVALTTGMAEVEFIRTCGLTTQLPYAMSKAAMNVLLAEYSAELKGEDIKVLPVSPGFVATWGKPSNPQAQAGIDFITSMFRKYRADFPGPSEPEESVRDMLKTIAAATMEQSGKMISHHGDSQWL